MAKFVGIIAECRFGDKDIAVWKVNETFHITVERLRTQKGLSAEEVIRWCFNAMNNK
jgi:hypothetical protein